MDELKYRGVKVIHKSNKVEELDDNTTEKTTTIPQDDDDTISFSFFDIIRMLLGLLVLLVSISWWFTGTGTFGYEGKLIDPHFLKFQIFGSYLNLTDLELSKFNGSIEGKPIYIGINGTVFDVSSSPGIYGPGGSYNYLAGKDCARAYATNCLNQLNYDIRDLEPSEKRRLKGWYEFFEKKYFKVGVVNHEPLVGPGPDRSDCRGKNHY
ncbi:hypothetical protein BN7_2804 [Wickerhamomyces ciferrii]|uniref:Cytochrome b5 heme-binding domain-containing protein n=1 Tax=Wickerhamomyces ciferrii (strain ATCC 14091 / BCRC 22168 / CBS 111 / JCM 3599 / NBRC 0793 / NRRL Y-1031 F-60-10) TaxID=1206466 RepID=K0KK23_WICCF|nr:uncharacterized protein BN7_2804 [Wickerhamomyces ciferrii]CCH43256.1 hypothetical protein BN7_2804 [Wickerhamomyces ciferrii]